MAASSPQQTHRRRKKLPSSSNVNASHGSIVVDPVSNTPKPAFPLAAFLWPARSVTSQWAVLPLVLIVAGLFRWAVGLWGYSGFKSPPMHGDFEAQRHWMEVTINLPVSQWYFHQLEWWGLDYPPLTAYHSWMVGKIGSLINPSWFALYTSRGLDDPSLKLFMRASVLVSEYLLYIPAGAVLLRRLSRLEGVHAWDYSIALVALLMQPSTILIDHAHFQYNTVMLGFVLASMASLMTGKLLWGCVFFVAALGFKQMALYYAPAFFAYLLGICLFPRLRLERLFYITVATVISFALLFAPLMLGALYDARLGVPPDPEVEDFIVPTIHPLLSSLPLPAGLQIKADAIYYPALHQLAQSIHRIFPFARGLFEDKVANIWCTLNLVVKLRYYSNATLQRLSLIATLAAIAPPCTILFFKPKKQLLSLALATTAWGFFLCSFQVHEKSVLLPLLPMTVLLAADGGLSPSVRAWVGWANILGAWTMFPLLKRDELRIPYYVLTFLWAYILGLPPTSPSLYWGRRRSSGDLGMSTKVLHVTFYIWMIGWHVVEGFVEPPKGLPDLWVVINVAVGTAGFGICYLWCLWRLAALSGLIEPPESRKRAGDKGKQKAL